MRHSELGCIAHVYSNGRATPKTCNENKSSRSSDRPGADEQRSRAGVAHSLGTLQERGDAAVRRPAAHGSGPHRRHRPACSLRPRLVSSPVGRVRNRGIGARTRLARHRAEEPLSRDGRYRLPRSQVRCARHRGIRRGHARYAGGRAEPTGRSLHGGRHGRLGPHRVDAHSRLRARSHVQQGTAALRPRLSRRRAAARGARSHRAWWPSTGSRWRPGT